jgi:hypothetical protein
MKTVRTASAVMAALAVLPFALEANESARAPQAQSRKLDLKASDIRKIFSSEQIDAVLRQAKDPTLEHIEVEALPLDDLPLRDKSAPIFERALRRGLGWIAPSELAAAGPPTDDDRPPPFAQTMYHPSFPRPASQR